MIGALGASIIERGVAWPVTPETSEPRRRALFQDHALTAVSSSCQAVQAHYSRPAATMRARNCCAASSPGAPEDLLGRPLLEDRARLEEADTVGNVASEAHLVRRDEHRHPPRGELADHVEHLGRPAPGRARS